MATVQPSFTQSAFRFRNDNGSETTATWAATSGTNVNFSPITTFRLRFVVQQTAAATTGLTQTFKLRYSLNAAAYADVGLIGTTATPIIFANSANVTDGTVTTKQLGAGTFVAGGIDNNNAQSVTYTSGSATETEIEFVLQLYAPLSKPGDTIDLRVYYATSTALNVYTVTPRVQRLRRSYVLG